jgi:16S rRNA (cytosine1402-N4)-methyltransferase
MHKSVLLEEVSHLLEVKPKEVVVDCTLGEGGHSERLITDASGDVVLVAIDLDSNAIERAKKRLDCFGCQKFFYHGNFSDIDLALKNAGLNKADKIIADLGLSSYQLDISGRGFSFRKEEPLLMTFKDDPGESDVTAYDVVNYWSEESLADIIFGFGEERAARKIAKAIVLARDKKPISNTSELAEIIKSVLPKQSKIDPATKTFQAIRMAVNKEVENLKILLEKGFALLNKGGRMAVISFHSIEDRIVKVFSKAKEEEGAVKILTKKPILSGKEERLLNRRSRSAKLRVFEKVV